MKKIFTGYYLIVLLFITMKTNVSFAQILSYTGETNGSLNFVAANATGTGLLRVNGAQPDSSCDIGFSISNFSSTATYSPSLAAVEVSVTPDSGFSLNVTGFAADLGRSGTGPSNVRFAYSTDGGNTWIDEGSDQLNHPGSCGNAYRLSWSTSLSIDAPATLKFRIYGYDANQPSGNEQVYNLEINGTVSSQVACDPPSELSAGNITSSSATLSWNAVSGATKYSIRYRETDSTTWTFTTSTTSSVDISGLTPATTYEFRVKTICSNGTKSVTSPSATFTTSASDCGIALDLSAGNITSSSATLSWSAVSGASGYNIRYRQTGTSTWTNTTSSTSSADISGLLSSTTYEFQVQTVCSGGTTSAFSPSATFTTLAPDCGIASGLSADNITASSATLSWSAVSGASSYNVQYRQTGTSTWTSTTSSTTSVVVSGLLSSTTYEFQVQTVCSGGTTSAFSPSATFTTLAPDCGIASGLSADNITASSATLSWSAVSGASSYNVQYRQTGTSTWTSTTSSTTSVVVSGLLSSTTYEFQVQTVCSGGTTSAFSSSATFTTLAPDCGIASGLSAGSITESSATLSWSAVLGASSYNVRYRKTGTSTWTNTTSLTPLVIVLGLLSSTTYEFQVQTVCLGGTTSAFSPSATFTTLAVIVGTVPTPDHVVILILENHAYSDIIGSAAAPHINALANDPSSALFTQSFAIEHPSQPNYLDFYSGSNQGVTDDNVPLGIPFTTANLGRQLMDASDSFTTYSEDLPSVGYNGATYFAYARKHNPAANWMGTGTNQIPSTTNQPFTAFPTDFTKLPTVSYVVPNQNNDMHNGTDPTRITVGDDWMYNNLNPYIEWAKTHNSLFILTFDEDDDAHNNHIVTIFTGAMVAAGQYSDHIDHYDVLRTIEDMYGLPYAGKASSASSITNCWNSNFTSTNSSNAVSPAGGVAKITVYPNPAKSWINFSLDKVPVSPVLIRIFDATGRLEGEYQLANTKNLKVNIASLPAGNYYYRMTQNNMLLHSGAFVVTGK